MLGGGTDIRHSPAPARPGYLAEHDGIRGRPRRLDLITAETDRLLETIHGLDDEAVRRPSRCPGWTRAHVLTHIARNADGLRDVLRAATNGTEGAMYESQARRDGGHRGRRRPLARPSWRPTSRPRPTRLLAALAETSARGPGRSRCRGCSWSTTAERQQLMPVRKVPLLRLREVVLHHVDLDAGYTIDDAPPAFVIGELGRLGPPFTDEPPRPGRRGGRSLALRPAGRTTRSASAVRRRDLLGWITGREPGIGLTSSSGQRPDLATVGHDTTARSRRCQPRAERQA